MAKTQNRVTAASMLRRAVAHGKKAKEHRLKARTGLRSYREAEESAVAVMHEETRAILRAEAKEIRSHP